MRFTAQNSRQLSMTWKLSNERMNKMDEYPARVLILPLRHGSKPIHTPPWPRRHDRLAEPFDILQVEFQVIQTLLRHPFPHTRKQFLYRPPKRPIFKEADLPRLIFGCL